MARRSSNNRRTTARAGRVIFHSNANLRLPQPSPFLSPLRLIEDRRLYHPSKLPSARSFNSFHHTLVARAPSVKPSRSGRFSYSPKTSIGIAFKAPDRVLLCVRRHRRKEVLHALRKTGRVGQRRPRRNEYSSISC